MNETDLQRLLGKLEAKVDLILVHQEGVTRRHDNIETRVSQVEKDLERAKGIGAILLLFVPIGISFINSLLK